ncbi:MAG: polyphosphate kinase 2, partial [Ilumatobacteraceae bacterium]
GFDAPTGNPDDYRRSGRLRAAVYEAEMKRLQEQLVLLQYWIQTQGLKVLVIFEGRGSAGKGGVIKRITERTSPRTVRVVALPRPTERERTQWYFQRYVQHLPAAGEIVFFDRSWYNRAGVERVMEFATAEEVGRFFRQVVPFEEFLVNDGIHLVKVWLEVSQDEQLRRLDARRTDPLKQWKISPIDEAAVGRWDDYTRAMVEMFMLTDAKTSPWWFVNNNNKKVGRLNILRHLLHLIPYEGKDDDVVREPDPTIVRAVRDLLPDLTG